MKLSLVCFLFLLVSLFVTPENAVAQANTTRPTSEQSLQELVSEVRQLRATLQRINSAMYKGQVMLERLKLQQEQVSRMTRELAEARESLSEMRTHQNKLNDLLLKTEVTVLKGERHPSEVAQLRGELEMLKEREQRLAAREVRLASDLEMERARLNDLNDRLNAFELELAPK